ncbi:MAG: XRE family transcriptional regulator [Cytophagaceae bacterium]|nr:MAG: XRE family transcriptional regulator [Cytophagaceae bacterium]
MCAWPARIRSDFYPATVAVPLSWLGDMLIAARKEQGISQQKLGERLSIHQNAVARMEKDKFRATSLERLIRVAEALELSLQIVSAE